MTFGVHELQHLNAGSRAVDANVSPLPPSVLGYPAAFTGKYSTFPPIIPHPPGKCCRRQSDPDAYRDQIL